MVFSSTLFLFLFLPLVLLLHAVAGIRFRNAVLLIASLLFYSWGEGKYVFVMFYCIAVSWWFGKQLDRAELATSRKRLMLLAAVLNLLPLFYYKYAAFFASNITALFAIDSTGVCLEDDIHLPIGISFFTFQALSYVIDIYRKQSLPQRSLLNIGLYISLFPQLIAGPIIRYRDISAQLNDRVNSIGLFASGCERFIFGLGKKVLIANQLGLMADTIFALPATELTIATAWLGVVVYALQIYFDFSGYSDMAIGLGRMLGFRFMENFNYPYISRSIQEFWRRWHISLSTWFRDYVYIPLGGNRGNDAAVMRNLLLVFLLCALWHGASWNFVVWGLIHGLFLVLERGRFGQFIGRCAVPVQHLYVLVVVLVAWVFFRVDNIENGFEYLRALFNPDGDQVLHPLVWIRMDRSFIAAFTLALIFSTPLFSLVRGLLTNTLAQSSSALKVAAAHCFRITLLTSVLILSVFDIASGSYNPFIYFRF